MNAVENVKQNRVPEDRSRLLVLDLPGPASDLESLLQALREDKVILFRNLDASRADAILRHIAGAFRLLERLELQATFTNMAGHRDRVSAYRMTVNARSLYQFIPPHSEGDSFTTMQLASFYCSENSTDGGVTVLVNIDDSAPTWPAMRELVIRLAPGSRPLKSGDLRRATMMYHLRDPAHLQDGDTIVDEHRCAIPGLALLDALAPPRRVRSFILERDLYSYWDSIASVDRSAVATHVSVLRGSGALKEPDGWGLAQLDNSTERRIWSSGIDHASILKCTVTHKLAPGELIVMNNLTWAHSATNWTPGSGVRSVSAAFA